MNGVELRCRARAGENPLDFCIILREKNEKNCFRFCTFKMITRVARARFRAFALNSARLNRKAFKGARCTTRAANFARAETRTFAFFSTCARRTTRCCSSSRTTFSRNASG